MKFKPHYNALMSKFVLLIRVEKNPMLICCLQIELLAHSFLFISLSLVAEEFWLLLEVEVCHKIDFPSIVRIGIKRSLYSCKRICTSIKMN